MISQHTIAFVGIGAIGLPMATQLLKAGYDVIGIDAFALQREKADALGIRTGSRAADAADADIAIVMVATPSQLKEVIDGEEGLFSCMREGSTVVIMSTVGPIAVQEAAVTAQHFGINLVDAPVTGGVARAKTGELTIFLAGPEPTTEYIAPVLKVLGTIAPISATLGDGQSTKVINQLLCSVHIAAAAEALALAEALGLDPSKTFNAVNSGAGHSWMLNDRGPRMLKGKDAEVTSSIGIFVKDSGLVVDTAKSINFDTPLARAAQERYNTADEMGFVQLDDSQVIWTYRNAGT